MHTTLRSSASRHRSAIPRRRLKAEPARRCLIDGVPVPESLLQPVMAGVGDQYPALTSSGRDLYVEIPAGGRMALRSDSVALALP